LKNALACVETYRNVDVTMPFDGDLDVVVVAVSVDIVALAEGRDVVLVAQLGSML
jgi:hypothetical protein